MSSSPARESGATLPRLKLAPQQEGFASHAGPFYEIALPHGMRRAVLLDGRHLSPAGVVHAGVIATFADYVLARGVKDEVGSEVRYLTVDLHCQYLAAAFPNRWIYGEAHILRRTRSLVFAAGEIFDQQRRIAFVNGIWKRVGEG